MNAIVKHEQNTAIAAVEQTVVNGDLSKLDAPGRVMYYRQVCESLGLNPFTRPFEYITLQGKLTLYARKDATEQLRKINGVSITKLEASVVDDLYIVTATAQDKLGRLDQSTGAVSIAGLKGEAKANAIMKAETKAKRRVTLSIGGLGWADESEIESIPGAQRVVVADTGEIIESSTSQSTLPQPAAFVPAPTAQKQDAPMPKTQVAPPGASNGRNGHGNGSVTTPHKRLFGEGITTFSPVRWDELRPTIVSAITNAESESESSLTDDEREALADSFKANRRQWQTWASGKGLMPQVPERTADGDKLEEQAATALATGEMAF